MSNTAKIIIVIVVLVFLVWGLSLLNVKPATTTNTGPIKIGAVLPITGAGAAYGENQRNAILLAVKEINNAGGIDGRKLEVIVEDDHTDPKTTVTSAQKLINVDKVTLIIGGVWNHLAEAVIPVIDQAKVILISPTVSADSLTSKSPYAFFTFPTVASNESVFKQFLSKYRGAKVAIIIWNNTWGIAHADEFKKAINSTDNTMIKEVILPFPDNNDIRGQLTLLKPLNPDIIFTAFNLGDSSSFTKIKQEIGIQAAVFNHYNMASAYLNGLISKSDMEGYYFFRPTPASSEFIENYRKEYGKEPDIPDADSAYDAVYVVKMAIENSGGKYDTESIISGLRKIRGYQGASGLIDYTSNNWPQNKVPYLEVFKNGNFIPVNN